MLSEEHTQDEICMKKTTSSFLNCAPSRQALPGVAAPIAVCTKNPIECSWHDGTVSPPNAAQASHTTPTQVPLPPIPSFPPTTTPTRAWGAAAAAQPRPSYCSDFTPVHSKEVLDAVPSTFAELHTPSPTSRLVTLGPLQLPRAYARPGISVLTTAAYSLSPRGPFHFLNCHTRRSAFSCPYHWQPDPPRPPNWRACCFAPAVTANEFAPTAQSAAFPSFEAAKSAI